MRIINIISLLFSCVVNAQNITINAPGPGIPINGVGTAITINHTPPTFTGVSKQQINIAWQAEPGADLYVIKRATDASFTDEAPVYAGDDLFFANTSLTQNTKYHYKIYKVVNDVETIIGTDSATTLNAGITYDIDAEAIIAAIQTRVTLSTSAKEVIDYFVTTSKANGLWTKQKAIYVGKFADYIANSINWKIPSFEMEGFPETYSGSVTHANGKISFAGVGASTEAAATRAFSTNFFVPNVYLALDNKGYSFNITDAPTNTSASDQFIFGVKDNSPNTADFLSIRGKPLGVSQNDEAGISGVNVTGSNFMDDNLPGLYVYERKAAAADSVLLRKNGVNLLTTLNTSSVNIDLPIATGGYYNNSFLINPLGYKTYGRDFFAIHESFTGAELTLWESLVDSLLTVLNTQTYTPQANPPTTGSSIRFLGDSFTEWPAASVSSGEKGYYIRLANRFHILPITHGQSSTGFFHAANNANSNFDTPSPDRLSILVGYNDVKVFGTNANGYEHAKSGIRSILTNQFLNTAIAANNGSVTASGTWTNPSIANSKADKLGGNELQSSTAGDYLEYTFSGDNIVIGVRNSDGTTLTYGSVEVRVDGNLETTYSANNKAYNVTTSGGAIWNAIILKGFGAGSHTVRVTLAASTTFIVDYFGTLRDPEDCFPVVIGDIQHDNTGTANRNENADALTQEIKDMIEDEFPEYSDIISFAKTNEGFIPAADVDPDNVHRNDSGNNKMYHQFERAWIK